MDHQDVIIDLVKIVYLDWYQGPDLLTLMN